MSHAETDRKGRDERIGIKTKSEEISIACSEQFHQKLIFSMIT